MKTTPKIVITGGPGGGKTTALDLFKRELIEHVSIVPESATILFSSGIRRSQNIDELTATQLAIYNFQKNLENLIHIQNPNHLLLCDRGTLDGLAYWPKSEGEFFETIHSNFDDELNEYSAVIFFQTAAKAGGDITTNNPYRSEDNKSAIEIDNKLQSIWSKHPNFHLIESNTSFIDKITHGANEIKKVIECLN